MHILDESIYYDRNGESITMEEWGDKMFQNYAYKVVRKTSILGMEVSTVWLGMDHSYGQDGPPVIFETMVFGAAEGTMWDDFQVRYCTEEQALEGHIKLVGEILPVKVLSNGVWHG